jgi:DNA polymerase III epsilon subunit-like protein
MVFGVLFGFRRSDFRSSDYSPSEYGNKFDHLILHRLIKQINPDAINKYWWCVNYYDTFLLAREKLPHLGKYNLKVLCDNFQIPTLGHHNAIYDCQMLKQLHSKLISIA